MQQRFRKLALFIGAAALSGASVLVVACGTDNGTATPTPQVDGSKPVGDGGKPDGNVDPEKDAGGDGGDGGVDCSKNPTLRDNTNGFRCAFKDRDAGGADASANCANTEECCNTESKATGPGYCATGKNGGDSLCVAQQPAGSTFNAGKGTVWECADKFACAPTQICCMIQDPARLALDPVKNKLNIGNTPPSQDANHPKACGVQYAYNAGGSRCKAPTGNNCPEALDIKLCSLKDNNCGAGTTCTPFIDFTNSVDRGFCK